MGMICELFVVPAQAARNVLADPAGIHELLQSLDQSDSALSLEKSWHGLHFALTGTEWGGKPPLNFLLGGVPVGNEDVGYGPARVSGPEDVLELDRVLAAISEEEFRRRFDFDGLAAADIYPQIWDEPVEELKDEYAGYFQAMKDHVRRAAAQGQALIITLR